MIRLTEREFFSSVLHLRTRDQSWSSPLHLAEIESASQLGPNVLYVRCRGLSRELLHWSTRVSLECFDSSARGVVDLGTLDHFADPRRGDTTLGFLVTIVQ